MILLKHFKKVASNKKTTDLVHKDGHKISIAHNSLSPKMRKQLDELPHLSDGGYLESDDKYKNKKKDNGTTNSNSNNTQSTTQSNTQYPQGTTSNSVHHIPYGMYDGGTVTPKPPPPPIDPDKAKQVQEGFKKALGFYDGGTAGLSSPISPEQYDSIPGKPQMPNSEQPTQDQSQVQSLQEPQNFNIPQPQQQGPQASALAPNASNYEKYLGNMAQGIQGEANAQSQAAKQTSQAAATQQSNTQDLAQHYQEKSDEINNERMAVYQDLKAGHIDQNHFLNSMSGFDRAMTTIGVALGGIGGALTGTDNHALTFLNRQIDRDIDAQKSQMDKKQNLVSILNQQMGNLKDATTMARAMQSDMYATKIEQIAQQSKDPQAQAKAQQMIAQMHMQNEPAIQQMKISQALLSGSESGKISPEVLVQRSPLVPEHQRPEMVKQLGKYRALEGLRQNMQESFDQIKGNFMNGLLSPNDAESAKQAFTGKLVQLSEGRYNYEAAQNLTNAMFPKSTDSSNTVNNKAVRLNNLIDSMQQEPKSALESVGIRLPKSIVHNKR